MKRYRAVLIIILVILLTGLILRNVVEADYYDWTKSSNYLSYTGGKVGIGTTKPIKKFEVVGDVRFGRSVGSKLIISTPVGGVRLNTGTSNLIIPFGKVGIGTLDPKKKLSVNGTIRAKEIIVDSGWADYVFEEDYNLMPLNVLSDFIEEEGRLPNIPSAAEVSGSGVAIGETYAQLLSKIEELTLYTLHQESQIVNLQNQLLESGK